MNTIKINETTYEIEEKVSALIVNISLERDELKAEVARFMSGDLGNIITHYELRAEKAEADSKELIAALKHVGGASCSAHYCGIIAQQALLDTEGKEE